MERDSLNPSKSLKTKRSKKIKPMERNKSNFRNSAFPYIQKKSEFITPLRQKNMIQKSTRGKYTNSFSIPRDDKGMMPSLKSHLQKNSRYKVNQTLNAGRPKRKTLGDKIGCQDQTPPKRLNFSLADHHRNHSKLSVFDRLHLNNIVHFNKSDEHCRECPACWKIKMELDPSYNKFREKLKAQRKMNNESSERKLKVNASERKLKQKSSKNKLKNKSSDRKLKNKPSQKKMKTKSSERRFQNFRGGFSNQRKPLPNKLKLLLNDQIDEELSDDLKKGPGNSKPKKSKRGSLNNRISSTQKRSNNTISKKSPVPEDPNIDLAEVEVDGEMGMFDKNRVSNTTKTIPGDSKLENLPPKQSEKSKITPKESSKSNILQESKKSKPSHQESIRSKPSQQESMRSK